MASQRCGVFPAPLAPTKPVIQPSGYGKACLGQGEARIFLCEIVNFCDIFHGRQLLHRMEGRKAMEGT